MSDCEDGKEKEWIELQQDANRQQRVGQREALALRGEPGGHGEGDGDEIVARERDRDRPEQEVDAKGDRGATAPALDEHQIDQSGDATHPQPERHEGARARREKCEGEWRQGERRILER